jgi:hypothetical protein
MKAEVDAVLLLEGVLAALAKFHHGRHVDLVEGRQHRGGLLRLDESRGDRLATAREPHALLVRPGLAGRRRGRC